MEGREGMMNRWENRETLTWEASVGERGARAEDSRESTNKKRKTKSKLEGTKKGLNNSQNKIHKH